jgi:yeast amino acid transporter
MFAWFEYVTSIIKIFLFLLIIILSLAIVLGAGPDGYVHHGTYWNTLPVFKNGFTVRSTNHALTRGRRY